MNRESLNFKQIKVVAVIVTFNRDELLERSLNKILNQTYPVYKILVIDNANLESTKILVNRFNGIYQVGKLEYGSAGGFKIGIKIALEQNIDFVWLLDDDGYPDENCLNQLLISAILHKVHAVSPLNISQSNLHNTANPYLLHFKKTISRSKLEKKIFRKNALQLYNGALISRETINKVGFPKPELFLRGDEMDYFYRLKRSGKKLGLVTNAYFYHPSGENEFENKQDAFLGVVYPQDSKKLYYQFRNRGYLVREHKLILNGLYDWFRYSSYYLLSNNRDINKFRIWKKLWCQGFLRNLTPYKENESE